MSTEAGRGRDDDSLAVVAQCSSQRLQDVPLAILSLPGLLQGVFIRFGLRRADNPKLLTNLEPNPKTWQPRSPTPPTSPETWRGELPASLRRSRPGCGEKAGRREAEVPTAQPTAARCPHNRCSPQILCSLAAVPGLHNGCSPGLAAATQVLTVCPPSRV